jgi:hypothetical protein
LKPLKHSYYNAKPVYQSLLRPSLGGGKISG